MSVHIESSASSPLALSNDHRHVPLPVGQAVDRDGRLAISWVADGGVEKQAKGKGRHTSC